MNEGRHIMLYSDPFETLMQLQQALDSFRSSSWLSTSTSGAGGFPPLNVFSKGDDIVIVAEAPGLKKDQLDIQVKGRTIQIAGVKSLSYGDNVSLHRRERTTGRFSRSLSLPVEIDADKIKAEYRDGMLAVFLPRAEHDKPRSIKIA
jgi:HSP20 family protein